MLLQLSWFVAASIMLSDRPDHDPTPAPETISVPTLAAPEMEKSAWVHAGFVASAWTLNGVTDAVTAVTYTLPELGLSKLPDRAAVAPGYRPVGDTVWFTVTLALVPALAVPEPLPPAVQKANAMPPSVSTKKTAYTTTAARLRRTPMMTISL